MARAKKPKYKLPEGFYKIMERGDFEEIKAVFQDEEMLKYLTESKESRHNPLFYYSPCTEIYKWFVEQGFDINMKNESDEKPIHYHAFCGENNIEGIILAGADIEAKYRDYYTPLQYAAKTLQPSSLGALIRRGADVHAKMSSTYPLGALLKYGEDACAKMYPGKGVLGLVLNNWDTKKIIRAVKCLELLIDAGVEIEDGMKDRVIEICKDFDRCKDSIYTRDGNPQPLEDAVTRMCELFGVERPASVVHDGKSLITVISTDWREQHAELWEMLVPGQGKCKTVQGEVVRIGGRINDEIFNQGGAHWDAEFRKMLNALKNYYVMGNIPDEDEHQEALALIKSIGKNSDGDDVLRLCEINIHWVLANPEPIALGEVNYKR